MSPGLLNLFYVLVLGCTLLLEKHSVMCVTTFNVTVCNSMPWAYCSKHNLKLIIWGKSVLHKSWKPPPKMNGKTTTAKKSMWLGIKLPGTAGLLGTNRLNDVCFLKNSEWRNYFWTTFLMIFLFGDSVDNSDDDDKVIVIVWNLSSYFMHISVPHILCRATK